MTDPDRETDPDGTLSKMVSRASYQNMRCLYSITESRKNEDLPNAEWRKSTCTNINITSFGDGNTAVIVAASFRTVSACQSKITIK